MQASVYLRVEIASLLPKGFSCPPPPSSHCENRLADKNNRSVFFLIGCIAAIYFELFLLDFLEFLLVTLHNFAAVSALSLLLTNNTVGSLS